MPARIIFSNVSSELDAGPSVHTILVWHGSVMRFTEDAIFVFVIVFKEPFVVDDSYVWDVRACENKVRKTLSHFK
jgi:hypothetical protein